MRFKFHDDKSRRQIDKFRNHRNNTSWINDLNLEEYRRKANRLRDLRGEWELSESIVTT